MSVRTGFGVILLISAITIRAVFGRVLLSKTVTSWSFTITTTFVAVGTKAITAPARRGKLTVRVHVDGKLLASFVFLCAVEVILVARGGGAPASLFAVRGLRRENARPTIRALQEAAVVGAVAGQHVELVERPLVQQELDPLPSEHLALGVLPLDGPLRPRVERLLLALGQLGQALAHGVLGHPGHGSSGPAHTKTRPRGQDPP